MITTIIPVNMMYFRFIRIVPNALANVPVHFRVLFTVVKYSKVRGIREAGELHRKIYNHCWPSTID